MTFVCDAGVGKRPGTRVGKMRQVSISDQQKGLPHSDLKNLIGDHGSCLKPLSQA